MGDTLPNLRDARFELDASGIATLTLDRDDVRNALTGTALIDDLLTTVAWINANEAVRVLIVTGAGSAFSAGGNLNDIADRKGDFEGDPATVAERYRNGIQRVPLAIEGLEVPSIAAINGPAIGAGFDFANMCDVRLASERARMGETFVNLGLIPGDGGAWYLQRLIGYQRAAELTFSGRVIDAAEAHALGIVLEVLAPDALLPRAREIAQDWAAKPRAALRYTKRLMKYAQRAELADVLDMSAEFQGQCHNDPEHWAAAAALRDKIKGTVSGKSGRK